MKISIRIYFLFVFILTTVACAAISYQLFKATTELAEVSEKMRLRSTNVFTAQSLRQDLTTFRRQALLHEIKESADRYATQEDAKLALMSKLALLIEKSETTTDKIHSENIKKHLENYLFRWGEAHGRKFKGERIYLYTAGAFDDTVNAIQDMLNYNFEKSGYIRDSAQAFSFRYRKNLLALWGAFLISIAFLFWSFYNLIYRPLNEFHKSLREFSVTGADRLDHRRTFYIREIRQIQTAYRLMKERLDRQTRQRLEFLAAIAHDLKNPLGALQMSMEILITDSPKSENREISNIVRRQFQQLARLINDLLDTSRIEAGELRFEKRNFSLPKLVQECVSLFQTYTSKHVFNISVEHPDCTVHADPDRIAQVVNNLLSNAIKYSPSGGPINVTVATQKNMAQVSVADKGVGIDAGDIEEIFEPFRRSKSAQHGLPGVGLGLSTSRKIVEGHGGTLSVQSNINEGTTFIFTLPRN